MSDQFPSKPNATESAPIGCTGLILRLIWLLGGNAALVLLGAAIWQKKAFSVLDLAFWAIVGALVLIRYIDITRFKGLTSNSEPATLGHWRRYTVKLVVLAGLFWGLAHAVPHFIRF